MFLIVIAICQRRYFSAAVRSVLCRCINVCHCLNLFYYLTLMNNKQTKASKLSSNDPSWVGAQQLVQLCSDYQYEADYKDLCNVEIGSLTCDFLRENWSDTPTS